MFVYTTSVLILCATLVLTSSVSKSETDGSSKDNHHVFHDNVDTFSSTISSSTTAVRVNNKNVPPIMAEGGPIYQTQRADSSSHLAKTVVSKLVTPIKAMEHTSDSSTSSDSKSFKLPKTRNASVVARKGVVPSSKITARKGVNADLSSSKESSIEDINDEAISRLPSRAKDKTSIKIHPSQAWFTTNDNGTMATEKMPLSESSKVHLSTNITTNKSSNVSTKNTEKFTTPSTMIKLVSTLATKIAKNTTKILSVPSTKRFKAKPTVTIGEMDIDKPIPASPTKTPPLGMPRKIDYIVPVIITIMALPLLGGATFFIYRRSRECWDKRHYRRMDFLIDGMYNDYSWK